MVPKYVRYRLNQQLTKNCHSVHFLVTRLSQRCSKRVQTEKICGYFLTRIDNQKIASRKDRQTGSAASPADNPSVFSIFRKFEVKSRRHRAHPDASASDQLSSQKFFGSFFQKRTLPFSGDQAAVRHPEFSTERSTTFPPRTTSVPCRGTSCHPAGWSSIGSDTKITPAPVSR